MQGWFLLAGLPLLLIAGCRERGGRSLQSQAHGGPQANSPQRDARPLVVFLGTSLTAGLGVDPDSAYPAVIQRKLDSAGIRLRVINAGVSGETSAGALRRLPFVLQGDIRVVLIETGANDGLRGLDVDSTRANLEAIVARARAYDSALTIVLAGMEAPPNLGPRFTAGFRALFPDIARRENLALIPFLLARVGGVDSLNQEDGIHPNSAGHRLVAENLWRVLAPLVEEERP
jgi:acyl-CoA thioesterase-1